MISEKMRSLGKKKSAIRELFEYAKARAAEIGEDKIFNFSIGNPSIEPPEIVNQTLLNLIETVPSTDLHAYTSAQGDRNVRHAIADHLNRTYGAKTDGELIYMTCAAAAALTISLHAVCLPGDEVILLAPYFPEYKVFAEGAGATVVSVPLDSAHRFAVDPEALAAAITPRTKAIIVNSPNNPTGTVLREDDIRALADVLRAAEAKYGREIYLISDEPYREIVYADGHLPFMTNYYDDTIVCYSFSKSLSLPGERIGYALVNPAARNAADLYAAICGAGRTLGFVCAPSLFQFMIPACLGRTADVSIYRRNRDILTEALTADGYEVVPSDGSFYLFVKSPIPDAAAFCEEAKKFELLLVPSDSFGIGGYVRIAYCTDTDMIRRSLPAFAALAAKYKNNR